MSTDPSPEAPRGRLIAFRPDRLGARLVSLMNAMRLSQALGAGFACAWTESAGVGQTFNDPTELFEDGFVARHFLSEEAWRAARPHALTLTGGSDPGEIRAALAGGGDVIVGNAFGIIRLDGEDDAETVRGFRAQFARIAFSGPVREAMLRLDALAGHTAYHIRRGDLTGDLKAMNKAWPHKVVPDEFYERHMATELERGSRGLVLFSDEAATVAHFRAAFPQLLTVAGLVELGALTEAQRDLVELYAMSRCERIIAPERSAFSSTAADIGGAVKQAVTESMAPAQADEAAEALVTRLRERADSFSGDGEIGQALAHSSAFLEREGRLAEAAALFAQHVEAGLNISFVYPQTMRYQHRTGDPAGVLRTAACMAAGHVVHARDYAAGELLHGYAHLRLGAVEAARRHIVNGFWHAPDGTMARLLVPVLVEGGLLGPDSFLPVSRVQLSLQRRRGPLKLLPTDFPGLEDATGAEVPRAIGSIETALWDWAPLLPALSLGGAVRKGAVAQAADLLARARVAPGDEPERASLAAILHAHAGEGERAVAELTALAQAAPQHAMTWQRLSHAHWQARRFGKAAEAAAQAAALSGWPAMRAWAGMALLRVREAEAAVGHLEAARAALPGWAGIEGLLAQALARAGRGDEALSASTRALELAPLEVEFAMLRARLLDAAGRTAEGVGVLERMVAVQRAPGKLFLALIDMLQRLGEAEQARATIEIAAPASRATRASRSLPAPPEAPGRPAAEPAGGGRLRQAERTAGRGRGDVSARGRPVLASAIKAPPGGGRRARSWSRPASPRQGGTATVAPLRHPADERRQSAGSVSRGQERHARIAVLPEHPREATAAEERHLQPRRETRPTTRATGTAGPGPGAMLRPPCPGGTCGGEGAVRQQLCPAMPGRFTARRGGASLAPR